MPIDVPVVLSTILLYKTLMDITKKLKSLFSQTRKIEAEILSLLIIVEKRKAYARDYSSLFDYCRKEFGLSDSQAQRRVSAVNAMRKNTCVDEAVRNGTLTGSQADLLGSLQTKAKNLGLDPDMNALVELAKDKTVRQTEDDAREFIGLEPKKKKLVIEIDDDLFEKWRRVCSIKDYKNDDQVLSELIDLELNRYEQKNYKLKKTTQKARAPSPALRHTLLKQADFKCQAKNCTSKVNLQVDHVVPWAFGGKTSVDNLRVLCRAHNLARAL